MTFRNSSLFLNLLAVFILLSCSNKGPTDQGSSQKEKNASGPIHLRGKIKDPISHSLQVSFKAFKKFWSFRTELDSSGRFSMEVPFDDHPSYFHLGQGKLSTYIFASPGDSIRLTAHGKKPMESLSFKGDAAKKNQYLLEWSRFKMDSFTKAKRGLFDSSNLHSVQRFKKELDSVYGMAGSFIEEHDDSLSSAFRKMERTRLQLDKYVRRSHYKRVRSYKLDSAERKNGLPSGFLEPGQDLDLSAPRNIAIPEYYTFLVSYGAHLKEQKGDPKKDSASSDQNELLQTYRSLQQKVESDTAEAAYLARKLYRRLIYRGPEHTAPLMEELKKKPLFGSLYDSLQSMREEWETLAKGRTAPGFSYPTVDGDTLSLQDLKGKYVYIDAWATWCGPCKREIPHLKELEEQFKDDPIAFVSISLDREDAKERWKKMVDEKGLGGHQLIANGEAFDSKLAREYLIRSIPRFILIGPQGKIIDRRAERPSKGGEEQLRKVLRTDSSSQKEA
ncbi:MAG: TlpA family protein disulfide reductase [Flavobacteriales bacterium]